MEENKPPDWKISELYSQAWQAIKKNKVLWLFGMAALTLTSNLSSHSNNINNTPTPPTTPTATQTLNAYATPFAQDLHQILAAVPAGTYILLGLGALLLILLGLVLNVTYSAWSEGALLQSTKNAINHQPVTIAGSSRPVFVKIAPLIWLTFVPMLVFLILAVIAFTITAVLLALVPGALKVIFGLLIAAEAIAFITGLIFIIMAKIWASRQIVLDGVYAKSAFFSSLKLAKQKFWSTLFLGIINTLFSAVIIFIPVVIVARAGIFAIFSLHKSGQIFGAGFWISVIPALIVLGLIYVIWAGILNAFKATIWTLAYQNIKGRLNAK